MECLLPSLKWPAALQIWLLFMLLSNKTSKQVPHVLFARLNQASYKCCHSAKSDRPSFFSEYSLLLFCCFDPLKFHGIFFKILSLRRISETRFYLGSNFMMLRAWDSMIRWLVLEINALCHALQFIKWCSYYVISSVGATKLCINCQIKQSYPPGIMHVVLFVQGFYTYMIIAANPPLTTVYTNTQIYVHKSGILIIFLEP